MKNEKNDECDPFIGRDPVIASLARQARRITECDSPVLIQGETGTGKGVLARWIHDNSTRRDGEFVDLNCACFGGDLLESELFGHERGAFTGALSQKRGLLEVANGGTVFFDEIGDMSSRVQPKLLKVVEERRFRRLGDIRERALSVRLISATHQDLERLTANKQFRSDLLYRINTIVITIPPLRERRADILELARALAHKIAGREIGFTPAAERILLAHDWPGNIRELRNVIDRAILFAQDNMIAESDITLRDGSTLSTTDITPLTMSDWERLHIFETLEREGWHVPTAATRLGIPRSSLYKKLRKYAGARSTQRPSNHDLGPN